MWLCAAAGGAAPFLLGAPCHPSTCRAPTREVWERCLGFVLVPHLRAETLSVGREPLSHADTPVFGEAPHLITGSVFAAQVPHFVFYPFWYPFGAFPGFGGVTSDLQLVSHEV